MGIRIEIDGQVYEAPADVAAEGGEALEAWARATVPGYPPPPAAPAPQVNDDAGSAE